MTVKESFLMVLALFVGLVLIMASAQPVDGGYRRVERPETEMVTETGKCMMNDGRLVTVEYLLIKPKDSIMGVQLLKCNDRLAPKMGD